MKGNFHVRFGEGGGETHWSQDQKVRSAPTLRTGGMLISALDEVKRGHGEYRTLKLYGKNAIT